MAYIEMNGAMKFLIVDYDESHAELMKRNLKKIGYSNSIHSTDPFEAFRIVRDGGIEFIICRFERDKFEGFEFFDEIKADYKIDRMPFMMFSESADDEDLALLIENGVDAHLSLPYVPKDLAGKIMATWSRYIDPENIEFHFEKARKLFLTKNFDEAQKIFMAIEKSGKALHRARVGQAKVAFELKLFDMAIRHGLSALEASPKYVHGHQILGESYLGKEMVTEAISALSKAIEISPKNPIRYELIGELLLGLKLWGHAEAILSQAISKGVETKAIVHGLATTLINQGKVDEAISYFEKLAEAYPKDVGYLNNLAVCYKKKDNINKAISYYKRAIELEPANVTIMFNLALSYEAKGKSEECLVHLDKIKELDPNHEKSYLKALQIRNPESYKTEMIRRRAKQKEQEEQEALEESEISTQVKTYDTSNIDQEALEGALQELSSGADKPTGHVPAKELEQIQALNLIKAQYLYVNAVTKVRQGFFQIMNEWFQSINEISEELAGDIMTIVQDMMSDSGGSALAEMADKGTSANELVLKIKEAIGDDEQLQENLMPIMMELQFQDYLTQTMDVLKNTFKISFQGRSSDWPKVRNALISPQQEELFDQHVGVKAAKERKSA